MNNLSMVFGWINEWQAWEIPERVVQETNVKPIILGVVPSFPPIASIRQVSNDRGSPYVYLSHKIFWKRLEKGLYARPIVIMDDDVQIGQTFGDKENSVPKTQTIFLYAWEPETNVEAKTCQIRSHETGWEVKWIGAYLIEVCFAHGE